MVSIIILIQDRYELVKRCLDSIINNTTVDYCELILVIQGLISEELQTYLYGFEDTCGYDYHFLVRIVRNFRNEGVTPGRNRGIELSHGDLILFFDDDAFVTDGCSSWLQELTEYFKMENVGIVGQAGSYVNKRDVGDGFIYCKQRGADCDVCQGYCFMFSREVVNKIGLLDPYFGKFWHEESEFALRAKANGFRVINAGNVGVNHFGSNTGDDGTYGQKYDYMYNKWKDKFDQILVPQDKRIPYD